MQKLKHWGLPLTMTGLLFIVGCASRTEEANNTNQPLVAGFTENKSRNDPTAIARPLMTGGDTASNADRIKQACEARFEANKADCNKFARAVASDVRITLNSGNADAIITELEAGGHFKPQDGPTARDKAVAGYLVIGGLKGGDMTVPETHGHLVVVVPGPLNRDKYPSAYWGKLGGVGKKNQTINWAWKQADLDKVTYYAISLP